MTRNVVVLLITSNFKLLLEHNHWLGVVFILYIFSLLVFATLYYAIHHCVPNSFSFNFDVSEAQDTSYRSQRAGRSQELEDSISRLEAMDSDFGEGEWRIKRERDSGNVKLRSKGGYEASFYIRRPLPSAAAKRKSRVSRPWKEFELKAPDGSTVIETQNMEFDKRFPHDVDDLRVMFRELVEELRQEADTYLEQATSPIQTPEIWTYWDFLYFSTVTQSTVGYGDILPNNTLVRMIVVLQVLIGIALAVVILNLVISVS
jgi:hypothetical protein